jgi:hypothetical protein
MDEQAEYVWHHGYRRLYIELNDNEPEGEDDE